MIDIVNSVQHHQPVFWNVDNSGLLESNRSNILHDNEQNQIAQKASTDLMAAINQLDINEDYRYVKNELFNELDGIINSTLQNYGDNLRYAINNIQSMNRDILSSPKITGLVKTNQQYKQWEQELRARPDISDDIKEMIVSENPYSFNLNYKKDANGNDILDGNGNKIEIGYNDWKPTTYAVEQLDYNDLIKIALSYINPKGGSYNGISRDVVQDGNVVSSIGGNTTFYTKDQNGNIVPTDDPTLAKYYITDDYSYQEITSADIILALVQAYNANPKFAASLDQDFRLAKWKYDQNNNNDVYGYKQLDGSINTKESYLFKMFENLTKTYAFKHENISRKYNIIKDDGNDLGNLGSYIEGLDRTIPVVVGEEEIIENPNQRVETQTQIDAEVNSLIESLN